MNTAPAVAYRRHLENGKLGYQRCAGCSAAIFYPRVLCPFCGSSELEWCESVGRGTVYATTAVHSRNRAPRNVVLVDLDEGFRMMSRVEGVPAEEVEIGTRVRSCLALSEGEPVRLNRGDAMFITQGEWHGVRNDTDQAASTLVIYAGAGTLEEAGYEEHPQQFDQT
jgi:uncharacterized protein